MSQEELLLHQQALFSQAREKMLKGQGEDEEGE